MSESTYYQLQFSSCLWICPNCGIPNFSDSFFEDHDYNLMSNQNRFSTLSNLPTNNTVIDKLSNNKSNNNQPQTKHNHKGKKKHIVAISLNVNGIVSKQLDLELLIQDNKPDIIFCQETKLDSNVNSSELFIPGFTVFRKDRDKFGGGVCIAVSDDLLATHCIDLDSDSESVWVKLDIVGHKSLYLCSF